MKKILLASLVLVLTACGGGSQQVLPPELQGNGGLPGETPINQNNGLPFDSSVQSPVSEEVAEEETEVASETVAEITAETNSAPPRIASNCDAITADLETSFADMNFCETNNDCAVAEGSCPFGCYLFHNARIDFEDYQEDLKAYQDGCNPCEYQCSEAPRAADRRCVEGRCVDIRFQES